jgi:hypothetical protein
MRVVAVAVLSLFAASPAAAYSIGAESIGAGGFVYSTAAGEAFVEIGDVLGDVAGNTVDGYASTAGDDGSMNGFMRVHIVDYGAAQSTVPINFLIEKRWKSIISETIETFQLDPGATELVVRLNVSGEDTSDLAIAPSPGFDNGYARAHVRAQLLYTNKNPHTAGLGQIQAIGSADRNVPFEWAQAFGGDSSPPGYGSASGGAASATAELHIPASEVDADDTLLVSGQLYGEVRGGHWNGAFAASEVRGGMSFEIVGGDGVPLNPIFLSAPEPDASLLEDFAAVALLVTSRRRASVSKR